MYIIITRNQCNFCDSAKALLRGLGISYIVYNVQSNSSSWILTLLKKSDLKTVPQIFAPDGNHIGGYADLVTHLDLT